MQPLCQAWAPPEAVDTLWGCPWEWEHLWVLLEGAGEEQHLDVHHKTPSTAPGEIPHPVCAQWGSQSIPLALQGGNQTDLSGQLWVLLEFEQAGHAGLGFTRLPGLSLVLREQTCSQGLPPNCPRHGARRILPCSRGKGVGVVWS